MGRLPLAELDAARAAMVEERVQRGTNGAAGVEHIVDQHDIARVHIKADGARLHHRPYVVRGEIVAVEADVDVADRQVGAGQLTEERVEAAGQDGTASVDADDGEPRGLRVLLGDLMGDPSQGSPQIVVLKHDLLTHVCCLPGLSGPG